MFERLRAMRAYRRLARELRETNRHLARIADVLERQFPPAQSTVATTVDVVDVDLRLQRSAEAAEAEFFAKYGRTPTADEIMSWIADRPHLQ